MSEPSDPPAKPQPTERERLEDHLMFLSNRAQRYSIYDPRYVDYHRQIDEDLDSWRAAVAMESLDGDVVV